ncbi:MAG: c-type cytochrome biogenesis protein CcsB [Deltaproteobacteria bacterium]|nr:c-type cytochrome biogenesis protein CcsB [Candidatus Zymogenaceae bacterium]
MLSSVILSWVTFSYGAAFICFILNWMLKKDTARTLGEIIVGISFVVHLAAIILRWIESYRIGIGHIPLTNFYESLIFFSLVITFIYLVLRFVFRYTFLGVFMIPLSVLTLAYASLSPDVDQSIRPLIPALQSNWLTVHVMTCFLSYASFAFSFVVAVIYLFKGKRKGGSLPNRETLDELIYRGILAGMPLLTIGIITGAFWAHFAWGSYWSWDPKETWSLITWIVYALFLHARLIRGWRGTRSAVLSIVGFFCVAFTFLGVNFVLSGLHSYL